MKTIKGVNSRKMMQEIEELFTLNEKFKHIKKQYEDKKKKLEVSIKNFMYSNGGLDTLSFKTNESEKMVVKKVSPRKIIWDPDKLEEKLDKELCNELIEKIYVVNDMQGLIKYLKSCGVNPKKFKSFLNIEKKVKTDVLQQMDDLGEISLEDVKGCYVVKESESYLKITIQEEE